MTPVFLNILLEDGGTRRTLFNADRFWMLEENEGGGTLIDFDPADNNYALVVKETMEEINQLILGAKR